jgi:hypothetical protein
MTASFGGVPPAEGAYDSVFQQQIARQQAAADASQALGRDVVSPGAPFPVDTTPGPEPFEVFA